MQMKKRRIKRLIIITFFLFIIILIYHSRVEADSTIGFENNEYDNCDYKYNTKINSNAGINGSKCVEINLADYGSGYFSYKFTELNPTVRYKISIYVKTVNVVKAQNARENSGAFMYVYSGASANIHEELVGTNSYKKMEIVAYPLDGEIEVMCVLEDSKGIAYFDNLEIASIGSQEIYSTEGNIMMRYNDEVLQAIGGKENLQELCNNVQIAYNDLKEFIGRTPPCSYTRNSKSVIIIDLTLNLNTTATAFSNYGYILADRNEIVKDFNKLKYRKEKGQEDWSFMLLHELGHLFQNKMVWNFESEGLTDLQVAYILEKEKVGAAPSEYDAETLFIGKNINNAFYEMRTNKFYWLAYKLTSIAHEIGWDKFKTSYQNIDKKYGITGNNYSQIDKFYIYMDEIAKVNDEPLTNYFTATEWIDYVKYINGYKGNTVKSITLSEKTVSLKNNETKTINATVNPTSQGKIDWLSSDVDVATVNNGKIKAKKTGRAIITAVSRDSGVTGTVDLTVTGTAPTVKITSNPSTEIINTENVTYTFTWSTEVNGFTEEDITLTNGTKVLFSGNGKIYTLVVKNIGNYTQTVSIAANKCTDIYGNGNATAYITRTIKIETPDSVYKKGDINGDGKINLVDVLKLRRYIANLTKVKPKDEWDLTEEEQRRANVNEDGIINIADVLKLRRYIAATSNSTIAEKYPEWLEL